jgi:hypothetical protein
VAQVGHPGDVRIGASERWHVDYIELKIKHMQSKSLSAEEEASGAGRVGSVARSAQAIQTGSRQISNFQVFGSFKAVLPPTLENVSTSRLPPG